MDIWKVLELEPTTDKNLIKKSYMEKLNKYHPEEDPEGFQILRASYEEALKYKEEDLFDDSLEGQYLRELKELYKDFKKRIDVSNWQDLILNSDYIRIDTEDIIIEKTLEFLMDNYFIPKSVWLFLIEAFDIKTRKKDLCKEFHRDFINYILDFENADEFIRYNFFDIDNTTDYDELIGLCYKLNRSYSDCDKDFIEDLIKQIDAFNIYNLDIEIIKCGFLFTSENYEALEIKLKELNEKHPDDYKVLIELGFLYLNTQKYKEALDVFEKTNTHNTGDALRAIADCYFELGDYVRAKEQYKECIRISPNNTYIRQKFTDTNEKLVLFYEQILKNDKPYLVNDEELTDFEINYRLAVSYYNIINFEECFKILNKIKPNDDEDEELSAKYYDILSDTCLQLDNPEEAYNYIQKWKLISKPKDTMFLQEANSLMYLKRYDEVIDVCDKALDIYSDEVELYFTKMSAYLSQKKYDMTIEVGEEALLNVKDPLYIYSLLATAYFELGHFGDAMDACNNALNIYPCIVDVFLIKLKIFTEIENYEQTLEVCKICDSYNIENPDVLYYKSFAIRDKDDFLQTKEILLQAIKLKDDEPKYYYELSRVYFALSDYKNAIKSIEKAISLPESDPFAYVLFAKYLMLDRQIDKSLEYYNIALEKNPDSSGFIYCERGSLYDSIDNKDLAKEDYFKSISISPEISRAYGNLADIFREDKEYDQAVEYYTKQLKILESPYLYFYRGICYGEIDQTEKEIEDYKNAIKIDPSYGWAYSNLGYVYYIDYRNYDKALKYYKLALEKVPEMMNPYIYMISIYLKLKQSEKATELYNKALEIFKDEDDRECFYSQLGRMSYNTTNTKKTIELYEKAIELKKNNPNRTVYYNLALSYIDDRQYEKAEKLLKKAITFFPDYKLLYSGLAGLELVVRKRYKKALEYYKKYEKLSKEKAWIYLRLGKVYNKLNKNDLAKKYLIKSIELYKTKLKENPTSCTYDDLGSCYFEIGLIDLSLENYNKSIELFKTNPGCNKEGCDESFFGLYKVYNAKDDKEKAEEYLLKALEINNDIEYQLCYENLVDNNKKSFTNKTFSLFKNKK